MDLVLAAGETKELTGLALYEGRTDPSGIGNQLVGTSSNPVAVPVSATGQVSSESIGVSVVSATDPVTGGPSAETLGDAAVTCVGSVLALRIDPEILELV